MAAAAGGGHCERGGEVGARLPTSGAAEERGGKAPMRPSAAAAEQRSSRTRAEADTASGSRCRRGCSGARQGASRAIGGRVQARYRARRREEKGVGGGRGPHRRWREVGAVRLGDDRRWRGGDEEEATQGSSGE